MGSISCIEFDGGREEMKNNFLEYFLGIYLKGDSRILGFLDMVIILTGRRNKNIIELGC